MTVRDNPKFRNILSKFNPAESIILYSMWGGYRAKPNSTIPAFLDLIGNWETLHTSGHASQSDIRTLIDITKPDTIIPIHTDRPEVLQEICSEEKTITVHDGEEIVI